MTSSFLILSFEFTGIKQHQFGIKGKLHESQPRGIEDSSGDCFLVIRFPYQAPFKFEY